MHGTAINTLRITINIDAFNLAPSGELETSIADRQRLAAVMRDVRSVLTVLTRYDAPTNGLGIKAITRRLGFNEWRAVNGVLEAMSSFGIVEWFNGPGDPPSRRTWKLTKGRTIEKAVEAGDWYRVELVSDDDRTSAWESLMPGCAGIQDTLAVARLNWYGRIGERVRLSRILEWNAGAVVYDKPTEWTL